MEISKKQEGSSLTLFFSGRLDTSTAPIFEKEINENLKDISTLTLDFANLEYLSSAGLRILLIAQKMMAPPKKMIIKNANENIYEIFEITGFIDILTIVK